MRKKDDTELEKMILEVKREIAERIMNEMVEETVRLLNL
jgi:hypothetical protein